MLLGGMGPVGDLGPTAGKLFAAGYALYAGLMFLVVAGLLPLMAYSMALSYLALGTWLVVKGFGR